MRKSLIMRFEIAIVQFLLLNLVFLRF